MDFKQLEAFVQVAKHGSFSGAAEAMLVTQPTLSAQIRALENEMNVKLFERGRAGVYPTKQGEIFLQYARDLIYTREQAICDLYHYSKNIDGVLEIQTSSVPGEWMIPELLAEFSKEYPKVKFFVEQSDSLTVEKNLMENRGEIGFVGHRGSSRLDYHPLAKDDMVLITPNVERFRRLKKDKISIEEVKDEYFILREMGSGTRSDFEKQIEAADLQELKLQVIARMNSLAAIKQAVAGGLGVSIISGTAAKEVTAEGSYLIFSLKESFASRTFYVVNRKNAVLSPTAQVFKKFVKGLFVLEESEESSHADIILCD